MKDLEASHHQPLHETQHKNVKADINNITKIASEDIDNAIVCGKSDLVACNELLSIKNKSANKVENESALKKDTSDESDEDKMDSVRNILTEVVVEVDPSKRCQDSCDTEAEKQEQVKVVN